MAVPYHMFAVFDSGTAAPPSGLQLLTQARRRRADPFSEDGRRELERRASDTIEHAFAHYKEPSRRKLELGDGNAFTLEDGPFCHCAQRDDVSALFAGEISYWPDIDMVQSAHDAFVRGEPGGGRGLNDAGWLLDYYATFRDSLATHPEVIAETALQSLAAVRGQFAFVIYDKLARRVLAARDASGAQPLFWGMTPEESFLFGSDVTDLALCEPTATAFPAGSLYVSSSNTRAHSPGERGWVIVGEQWPGRLYSFVRLADDAGSGTTMGKPRAVSHWREIRAIPRINEKGCLCGAVYRVASGTNIKNTVSVHPSRDIF